MIQRCSNPNNKKWPSYGARGIEVCERWRNSFAAFRADMGSRPAGFSLERKNNDGGYEPSNCCWASAIEQVNNRRLLRTNRTGLEGIALQLRKKKWKYCAYVSIDGRRVHLGYFDDFFEACCKRKSAELLFLPRSMKGQP